jgi:hypothetical protein
VVKQSVDEGAGAMPRSGMDHEPGRFVDHDEKIVFEDNLERNRFGLEPARFGFGDLPRHLLTRVKPVGGLDR